MNKHLSLQTQVILTPRRSGLRAVEANVVDVLVRVQAPDAPADSQAFRPPQAVALVIDRSGSMTGRPLEQARRCAAFVVAKLRASDSVSVVQFDNRVERLSPCLPVGDGSVARRAIDGIAAGGNTNLHGGWLDGADSLGDVQGNGLKRVILLSDGQANEGITDPVEITRQCAAWAARGISTSTYGLGNHFNEELMVAMGRAGAGSHYYGETAEDLMEPFQQELDLLANLCIRRLTLAVQAADGVRVEMLNAHPAVAGGWHLPDLAWGAEAWALLRLQVPAGRLGGIGERVHLLQVAISGEDFAGQPVAIERAGLALPVLAPSQYDALPDDELVQRRAIEIDAAALLERVRAAALAHDWAAVEALLRDAEAKFSGNEWVAGILQAMRRAASARQSEVMAKEALYSSSKLSRRLSAKDEAAAFSADALSVPAYVRRKPQQGKGDA